jgi:(p)ppGpp synthase/HD superfamily hydrolase
MDSIPKNSWLDLIDRAASFANKAHAGQKRIGGGLYINHPQRVSEGVSDNVSKAAAWLHDVLEDTSVTEKELRENFPDNVVDIVKIVSRNKSETYFNFIMRIIRSKNQLALVVKLSDLKDNLIDLKEGSRKDKYRFAEYLIEQELKRMMDL